MCLARAGVAEADLNKGEARNSLARAVFKRLDHIGDRSFNVKRHRASGLGQVTAASTLWNVVYFERAAQCLVKLNAVELVERPCGSQQPY